MRFNAVWLFPLGGLVSATFYLACGTDTFLNAVPDGSVPLPDAGSLEDGPSVDAGTTDAALGTLVVTVTGVLPPTGNTSTNVTASGQRASDPRPTCTNVIKGPCTITLCALDAGVVAPLPPTGGKLTLRSRDAGLAELLPAADGGYPAFHEAGAPWGTALHGDAVTLGADGGDIPPFVLNGTSPETTFITSYQVLWSQAAGAALYWSGATSASQIVVELSTGGSPPAAHMVCEYSGNADAGSAVVPPDALAVVPTGAYTFTVLARNVATSRVQGWDVVLEMNSLLQLPQIVGGAPYTPSTFLLNVVP